jgi:Arc/MetJ-type ribon-helix-helix transcriptional regulator
MGVAKIAVSIDAKAVAKVDRLVKEGKFPSRSSLIQQAVEEKLARMKKTRLARECANLDPVEEKALAEEGLSAEASEWPEF